MWCKLCRVLWYAVECGGRGVSCALVCGEDDKTLRLGACFSYKYCYRCLSSVVVACSMWPAVEGMQQTERRKMP